MSMPENQIKNIIEAALFAFGKPLTLDAIFLLFKEEDGVTKDNLRDAIESIEEDCQTRGVELKKVASGYRFQAKQDYAKWLQPLWEEKPPRYSRALLETMVLIAYKQPITRGEIEDVRGVSVSSHIVKTLQERDWIRVVGHRDVPGKPALFATTKEFLDYFNLSSLDQLPSLAQIRDLDKINEELEFPDGMPSELEKMVTEGESQTEENQSISSEEKVIDDKQDAPMTESVAAEGELTDGMVEQIEAENSAQDSLRVGDYFAEESASSNDELPSEEASDLSDDDDMVTIDETTLVKNSTELEQETIVETDVLDTSPDEEIIAANPEELSVIEEFLEQATIKEQDEPLPSPESHSVHSQSTTEVEEKAGSQNEPAGDQIASAQSNDIISRDIIDEPNDVDVETDVTEQANSVD